MEVLKGTFDTGGCSQYMVKLIESLAKWEDVSSMKELFEISKESHQRAWQKQNAKTSSDSRGLSYSHYKGAAEYDSIAEVDSLFRNIPFQKGFSPKTWQRITDFQLLKKAGIFDVDLMRTIQLFTADFNMNNKALGKTVMSIGECVGYFPEEIRGSRKFKKAALTILNKVLINDIWRLKRVIAALCSTDAKSCYDRVIHWVAMLAMMRIEVPYEPLKSLFETIQQAVHLIVIENNLSPDSYDVAKLKISIHGLGQGNGAAPMIWVMVSAVIILIMKKKEHGVQLTSALSKEVASIVGFMFVDDFDLVEAFESP